MTTPETPNSAHNEIMKCLKLDNPKSFFLFAGAGSGKTRALVEILAEFRKNDVQELRRSGRNVGIITYTNAACDEIKHRLEYDPTFAVSTIHSFAWDLIEFHTKDIKEWLGHNLKLEIEKLIEDQKKGRPNTQAFADRTKKIKTKTEKLESLSAIKKFTYSPTGDNLSKASLTHTDVISIATDFLKNKPLMQHFLIQKFPILLIDESQDTQEELLDAFFQVQTTHEKMFTLGLFGDTMQRIYSHGKVELEQNIPNSWAKPALEINYRSSKRIVTLINKIRNDADDHIQKYAKKDDGYVRFFIVENQKGLDKALTETAIANRMSEITGDIDWTLTDDKVKILILEHNMAASRDGFSNFFIPLYKIKSYRTGLLDGTLPEISIFKNMIMPIIDAKINDNKFAVAQIIKKYSKLITKDKLRDSSNPIDDLSLANDAVKSLFALWDNNTPTLKEVLDNIYTSKLFQLHENLYLLANRLGDVDKYELDEDSKDESNNQKLDALNNALNASFDEFELYSKYISGQSRFGTHQGIKGLQFPRVMTIIDDEEERGFLFSYEKLFGGKSQTATDQRNQREGKETSIDRTRRLFYVTCSRAENSLAIVAYTKNPTTVKDYVIEQGWFEESEIIDIKDCSGSLA